MSNSHGKDGVLHLGGILVGSPIVNVALSEFDVQMDIDAASLTGIVAVGDTFTLAGETGSPTHTVTGGPFYVASGNAIASITFTPAIASGGVGDGAAVTFVSNSTGQIVEWSLDDAGLVEVNTTVKGLLATEYEGALHLYSGKATGYLDYDDPQQGALLDRIAGAVPTGAAIAALTLALESGKSLYCAAILSNFGIQSPDPESTSPVPVSFSFKGNGALAIDWTP